MLLTDWTWSQHWMGPVLQLLPVGPEAGAVAVTVIVVVDVAVVVGVFQGEAAARVATEARETSAVANFIFGECFGTG